MSKPIGVRKKSERDRQIISFPQRINVPSSRSESHNVKSLLVNLIIQVFLHLTPQLLKNLLATKGAEERTRVYISVWDPGGKPQPGSTDSLSESTNNREHHSSVTGAAGTIEVNSNIHCCLLTLIQPKNPSISKRNQAIRNGLCWGVCWKYNGFQQDRLQHA